MSILKMIFGGKKASAADQEGLDVHLGYLDSLRQQATVLSASHSPAVSRLGGLPNLPGDLAWPCWHGKPLAFLCQLDLTEIPEGLAGFLPNAGGLFFFYNQEQATWGFDPGDRDSWKVIYTDRLIATVPERAAPDGLDSDHIYRAKAVGFSAVETYPDWQDERVNALNLNDRQADQYFELVQAVYGDQPEHQLFGYAAPVQGNDMDLECQLVANGLYCGDSSGYNNPRAKELEPGRSDWQLLLQLDSDEEVGMMWGDCGRLYFWARRQDVAKLDFDNCWMILQCS